jgi:5'-methylthioadenosine phosphorylase
MLRTLGADLVGMTAVPEAIVAREAGIPYATLSIVTNMAAGMSTTPISHQDVSDIVTHLSERVSAILRTAIQCLV